MLRIVKLTSQMPECGISVMGQFSIDNICKMIVLKDHMYTSEKKSVKMVLKIKDN